MFVFRQRLNLLQKNLRTRRKHKNLRRQSKITNEELKVESLLS
ncbi:hypothetical protein MPTK1_2g19230 [Marchantia polymorpha subsp. ruderalis]|uniref:Uncharacterized protein n=1 Tax=Marchantia polymorpha TaxID=3197 RepID=A0A2R6WVK0_MARPO|nr:hypothetical protein MARPO_0055s0128 [Marchantia polymorpha]BBN02912.1 hypothetical protein Mp_2g19230 [Marchantia polymorpha subsp. ruderalis]|eukprot:PTQ37881.1 hypothetical protein MARPO_0055s0128 [Marchantia polymorpha]